MSNGTLLKIESWHDNMPEQPILVIFQELPKIGSRFYMYHAKGLGDFSTTEVQGIRKTDNGLMFRTKNSTYQLIIEDE